MLLKLELKCNTLCKKYCAVYRQEGSLKKEKKILQELFKQTKSIRIHDNSLVEY